MSTAKRIGVGYYADGYSTSSAGRRSYQTQQYVVHKQTCVAIYREAIEDQWTTLLATLDQRCRQAWQYRIPENAVERAELRAIGQEVLVFENHFLGMYHQFLLDELSSSDINAQITALAMLGRTWYPAPTIRAALQQLTNAPQIDIQTTAQQLITQHYTDR